MRHIAFFTGITLALATPLAAVAADSAALQVTGTITPASCDISLAGASSVQLDPVKLGDFTPDQDLVLAGKTASLVIDCQGAAAKFRLKATDSGEAPSAPGAAHYGLGWNVQGGSPKANGYFTLSIDAQSMTSNNFVLKSTDAGLGEAWSAPVQGDVPFDHDGEAFAFAADASATEPANLTTLTVPLKIGAVLAMNPIVNEDVEISGSATIEILY